MKKTRISNLKYAAAPLALGLALISTPSFAQDAAAEEEPAGEIIVTGSLIQNPNVVSTSPVTVVGAEEISLRQSNTAEQILRELPGVTPNLGGNVNNGQVGSARVDLRNLGADRNIVLLDGQRLVPSSWFGAVDLNNIPLALVDRVDVLTGGASTTYGADAVSGVVNFITRKDFAGLDFAVSQQLSEKGDGNVFRADLTVGANFDDGRGNAVLSIGYQEADPIYFGARDTGTFVIGSTTGFAGGDSPTSAPTTFSSAGLGTLQINPTGTGLVAPYAPFNFNPFNIYQTPFERFNFFGQTRYEVSDTVEVYSRALFSKNTVRSIIAASGIFGNTLTIPGNNPYLPAALRDQFCVAAGLAPGTGPTCGGNAAIPLGAVYRRSVELGPRISTYVTQVFDVMVGVRLNITDNLKFDAYGSYGESENEETRSGYVANSRVQQALNANNTTTCTNTANSCVPLNIFGPSGSITSEQGAFVGGVTSSVTNAASLAQVHAVLSGDFGFTIPSAAEAVSFAVGGEHRDYGAQRRPDNLAQVPGELGGAGGAILPLNGGFSVYEAFGEINVPIVSDKPFFNDLSVEAGVRYSDYSVRASGNPSFTATTYKFGGNWEPVEGVKFRSNYQRAVRAPNIGELFRPVVTGLDNLLIDPCAGAAPTTNANLAAVCRAQGAPASSVTGGTILNPAAAQANVTGGGNPNIRPEKAATYSFGLVLQPTGFLNGLTASIDYYNIKVTNAIKEATPGDIMQACFGNITAASATDPACTGIRRNAVNGRLSGTSTAANPIPGLPQPLTNLGKLATDGIDLVLNYKADLGFADLGLGFSGNYALSSNFQAAPTSVDRDCVGYYSVNCASIQPEYSWNQRTTLSFENVDVSLLWRHLSSVEYEGQASDAVKRGFATAAQQNLFVGAITGGGALVGRQVNFNRIKAYNYFDLAVRFDVTENFELAFNAFNIFDKQPPLVGSSAGATSYNGGNTYPSTYDTIGRRYGASLRMKF